MTVTCLKKDYYEARLTSKELQQLKKELKEESSVKYSEYNNVSIVEKNNKAVAVKIIVDVEKGE